MNFLSLFLQEDCSSLKRKLDKQKKIDLYGAADEVLLEEIKQYKVSIAQYLLRFICLNSQLSAK